MMKSWADHCSSDEEDSVHDDEEEVEDASKQVEEPVTADEEVGGTTSVAADSSHPAETTYDFPVRPPFTAFVGNLSFNIKEPKQLQQAVTDAVLQRLGERIDVIDGRIAFDRVDPNKHRGFGYVEVDTLEQLKTLMKLNDGQTIIAGRPIQLNTASNKNNNNNNRRGPNQQRGTFRDANSSGNNNARSSYRDNNANPRGSYQRNSQQGDSGVEIDGSKFRGGRYNGSSSTRQDGTPRIDTNNDNHRKSNYRHPGSSNIGDKNDPAPTPTTDGTAPLRPSLKLAPRTKPVDDSERRGSSSTIFGGAKARDEQAWKEKHTSEREPQGSQAPPLEAKEVSVNSKTKEEPKAPSSSTANETVVKIGAGDEEDGFAPVPSVSSNSGSNKSGQQLQDKRQSSGRGGHSGRGRAGRNAGGRQQDKGRGSQSGRRGSQQDKKVQHQGKQPKPEEKAPASAPTPKLNTAAPTPATAQQAPQKQKEPTNKFALLMDSDSE